MLMPCAIVWQDFLYSCSKYPKGTDVIQVTRFNGTMIFINAELVQIVESTPDTIITLTSGVKMVVSEKAEEVIDRIIDYRRKTLGQVALNLFNASKRGE